eukprot:Ihof_evm18s32 gene=Ihof_evmTU18s32
MSSCDSFSSAVASVDSNSSDSTQIGNANTPSSPLRPKNDINEITTTLEETTLTTPITSPASKHSSFTEQPHRLSMTPITKQSAESLDKEEVNGMPLLLKKEEGKTETCAPVTPIRSTSHRGSTTTTAPSPKTPKAPTAAGRRSSSSISAPSTTPINKGSGRRSSTSASTTSTTPVNKPLGRRSSSSATTPSTTPVKPALGPNCFTSGCIKYKTAAEIYKDAPKPGSNPRYAHVKPKVGSLDNINYGKSTTPTKKTTTPTKGAPAAIGDPRAFESFPIITKPISAHDIYKDGPKPGSNKKYAHVKSRIDSRNTAYQSPKSERKVITNNKIDLSHVQAKEVNCHRKHASIFHFMVLIISSYWFSKRLTVRLLFRLPKLNDHNHI